MRRVARGRACTLTVSVNLSARQFYRDDLAQRISEIVRDVGCDPSWIELEVTETSLLHDLDAIRKVLHQLRNEGFTVAIDDFGTGYSSLTHLKHFPIDTLKIDISFIADLETDAQDAAITEAIIGLARGLGLKVVAEGVGTQAQLEFLEARGCHCFQGFWVSQPLPTDQFLRIRAQAAGGARLIPPLRSEPLTPTARARAPAVSHLRSSIIMCASPGSIMASTPWWRAVAATSSAVEMRSPSAPSTSTGTPFRSGSCQCSRSDRSSSARGDSAPR